MVKRSTREQWSGSRRKSVFTGRMQSKVEELLSRLPDDFFAGDGRPGKRDMRLLARSLAREIVREVDSEKFVEQAQKYPVDVVADEIDNMPGVIKAAKEALSSRER